MRQQNLNYLNDKVKDSAYYKAYCIIIYRMRSYIPLSFSFKVSILIITFAMKFAAINIAGLSTLPDYTRAGV